jgi:putative transposase
MKYDPALHHRRSIRLKEYDYASPGAYFVTICVQNRECMLGEVVDGHMALSDEGRLVDQFWPMVADHFAGVAIDVRVTMPNHVHAIVVIGGGKGAPPLLGQIVAYFKYQTTKSINRLRGMPSVRFWQRNYWEHIVRDENEFAALHDYICTNPLRWADDQLHPAAPPNRFNRK